MTEKGDLISREALKDATKKLYNETLDGIVKFGIEKVYDLISNAPTVEPNQLTQDIIDKVNVNIGLAQPIKDARPQGKWIKIFENPFTNGYVCSFCGHKIQVTEQFLPKVTECEVCGADMRGEEE